MGCVHTELPLFPLPHVVRVPRTDVRLHIFEPRDPRPVLDLLEKGERRSRRLVLDALRPSRHLSRHPQRN